MSCNTRATLGDRKQTSFSLSFTFSLSLYYIHLPPSTHSNINTPSSLSFSKIPFQSLSLSLEKHAVSLLLRWNCVLCSCCISFIARSEIPRTKRCWFAKGADPKRIWSNFSLLSLVDLERSRIRNACVLYGFGVSVLRFVDLEWFLDVFFSSSLSFAMRFLRIRWIWSDSSLDFSLL